MGAIRRGITVYLTSSRTFAHVVTRRLLGQTVQALPCRPCCLTDRNPFQAGLSVLTRFPFLFLADPNFVAAAVMTAVRRQSLQTDTRTTC